MLDFECENEDCREPSGRPAYVVFGDEGKFFCLSCYLIFDRGMDPDDAADVEFQGGR